MNHSYSMFRNSFIAVILLAGSIMATGCMAASEPESTADSTEESSSKDGHSMLVANTKLSYDNESAKVDGFAEGVETRVASASIEIGDVTSNDLLDEELKAQEQVSSNVCFPIPHWCPAQWSCDYIHYYTTK